MSDTPDLQFLETAFAPVEGSMPSIFRTRTSNEHHHAVESNDSIPRIIPRSFSVEWYSATRAADGGDDGGGEDSQSQYSKKSLALSEVDSQMLSIRSKKSLAISEIDSAAYVDDSCTDNDSLSMNSGSVRRALVRDFSLKEDEERQQTSTSSRSTNPQIPAEVSTTRTTNTKILLGGQLQDVINEQKSRSLPSGTHNNIPSATANHDRDIKSRDIAEPSQSTDRSPRPRWIGRLVEDQTTKSPSTHEDDTPTAANLVGANGDDDYADHPRHNFSRHHSVPDDYMIHHEPYPDHHLALGEMPTSIDDFDSSEEKIEEDPDSSIIALTRSRSFDSSNEKNTTPKLDVTAANLMWKRRCIEAEERVRSLSKRVIREEQISRQLSSQIRESNWEKETLQVELSHIQNDLKRNEEEKDSVLASSSPLRPYQNSDDLVVRLKAIEDKYDTSQRNFYELLKDRNYLVKKLQKVELVSQISQKENDLTLNSLHQESQRARQLEDELSLAQQELEAIKNNHQPSSHENTIQETDDQVQSSVTKSQAVDPETALPPVSGQMGTVVPHLENRLNALRATVAETRISMEALLLKATNSASSAKAKDDSNNRIDLQPIDPQSQFETAEVCLCSTEMDVKAIHVAALDLEEQFEGMEREKRNLSKTVDDMKSRTADLHKCAEQAQAEEDDALQELNNIQSLHSTELDKVKKGDDEAKAALLLERNLNASRSATSASAPHMQNYIAKKDESEQDMAAGLRLELEEVRKEQIETEQALRSLQGEYKSLEQKSKEELETLRIELMAKNEDLSARNVNLESELENAVRTSSTLRSLPTTTQNSNDKDKDPAMQELLLRIAQLGQTEDAAKESLDKATAKLEGIKKQNTEELAHLESTLKEKHVAEKQALLYSHVAEVETLKASLATEASMLLQESRESSASEKAAEILKVKQDAESALQRLRADMEESKAADLKRVQDDAVFALEKAKSEMNNVREQYEQRNIVAEEVSMKSAQELDATREREQTLRLQVQELEARITAVNDEKEAILAASKDREENFKNAIEESLSIQRSSFEATLEESCKRHEEDEKIMSELRTKVDELEKANDTSEKKIKSLMTKLEDVESARSQEHKAQEKRLRAAETDLCNRESKIAELSAIVVTMESKIEALGAENEALLSSKQGLENAATAKEKSIRDNESQITLLTSMLSDMECKLVAKSAEYESTLMRKQELQDALVLTGEYQRPSTAQKGLQDAVVQKDNRIADLETTLSSLRGEKEALQAVEADSICKEAQIEKLLATVALLESQAETPKEEKVELEASTKRFEEDECLRIAELEAKLAGVTFACQKMAPSNSDDRGPIELQRTKERQNLTQQQTNGTLANCGPHKTGASETRERRSTLENVSCDTLFDAIDDSADQKIPHDLQAENPPNSERLYREERSSSSDDFFARRSSKHAQGAIQATSLNLESTVSNQSENEVELSQTLEEDTTRAEETRVYQQCIDLDLHYHDSESIEKIQIVQAKYTGALLNGVPHGPGTLRFLNGDMYLGEFENGEMCGVGAFNHIRQGDGKSQTLFGIFDHNEYRGHRQQKKPAIRRILVSRSSSMSLPDSNLQ